jgi:CYTH domain-containing protein
MDKTYRTELRRVFLLADLPAPLTRASEHLQFFDNYIENTRLRLRSIRAPHTKEWFWVLEQRFQVEENDFSRWQISEILLNEKEHAAFEIFEGREVRKNERVETNELRFNRYSFEWKDRAITIDFYLNPLWGLILAKVFFQTEEEMQKFTKPDFALAEVTQNESFSSKNLVGKTFADI